MRFKDTKVGLCTFNLCLFGFSIINYGERIRWQIEINTQTREPALDFIYTALLLFHFTLRGGVLLLCTRGSVPEEYWIKILFVFEHFIVVVLSLPLCSRVFEWEKEFLSYLCGRQEWQYCQSFMQSFCQNEK